MSPRVGHISFPLQRPEEAGKRPYSHWLSAEIDGEVRRLVAEATAHTENLLRKNSHLLEKVRFAGHTECTCSHSSHTHTLSLPPLPPFLAGQGTT